MQIDSYTACEYFGHTYQHETDGPDAETYEQCVDCGEPRETDD